MTEAELKVIAALAIIGLSSRPNAGADAESVADRHVLERDVLFGAISAKSASRLRRETEQIPNRAARAAARARNSSTCPSSTSTTMTAAGSK